jgi:hypothetical protein
MSGIFLPVIMALGYWYGMKNFLGDCAGINITA